MTFRITENLKNAVELSQVTPAIVAKIDGIATLFTNVKISRYIRIGDPGLLIGNTWKIGGFTLLEGQSDYITFNTGQTTKISQKLNVSRAQGSSVSAMVLSLVDKNEEITELVSPGFETEEVIGRDVAIYLGVKEGTAFPEDYYVAFRGVVQGIDAGAGYINLILSNTEEKKRTNIFKRVSIDTSAIQNIGDTTLALTDATDFPVPADTFETYLKIQDEFEKYTGKSTNTLTGITRGAQGTTPASHSTGSSAERWGKITDNVMTLALKLYLSGAPTYYIDGIDVDGFTILSPFQTVDNALFFKKIDLETEHGIAIGDTVEITGATNAGNNITTTIAEIGMIDDTTYVIVNDPITAENPTSASAKFKSQFNTLPIGVGLLPKEVDVAQHLYIRDTFIPLFTMELWFNEIGNAKEFIEQNLYLPAACFSVPRKGRVSVVYHIAPLPTSEVKTLDTKTVKNAAALKLQRSLNENFFNEVNFEYDFDPVSEKYKSTQSVESATSKTRIATLGDRPLTIKSQGISTGNGGDVRTVQAARRLLKRYQYGAEFIKSIQIHFKTGYAAEIGDIFLVDFDALKLSNYDEGLRGGGLKLVEVLNKNIDQKTGEISIDIVNTAFGVDDRFGLISPSSIVASGSTTTRIKIEKSFTTKSFQRESTKWSAYIGQNIRVRDVNFSTVYTTTIRGFDNNTPQGMIVDALPAPPLAGWIIDIVPYPSTTNERDELFYKMRHAFFSPQVPVTATVGGSPQTKFKVSVPNAAKFLVGASVRVHSYDYTDDGGDTTVIGVVGDEIEIEDATGFTIGTTHFVDLIGFPDGGAAYRII